LQNNKIVTEIGQLQLNLIKETKIAKKIFMKNNKLKIIIS
jgi:hypothetical protein